MKQSSYRKKGQARVDQNNVGNQSSMTANLTTASNLHFVPSRPFKHRQE